jgi:hypothetical protein
LVMVKLLRVSKVSKSRQVITVLERSRQVIDVDHINFFRRDLQAKGLMASILVLND